MSKQGRAATGRHSIDYRRSGDSGELAAQGSCRGVGEPPKGRAPGAAIPWGDPRSIWPTRMVHGGKPEWIPRPGPAPEISVRGDGYYIDGHRVWIRRGGVSPIIGIALGHVRARARMERALDWLECAGACEPGVRFAMRTSSPEQAVWAAMLSARGWTSWLMDVVGGPWLDKWLSAIGSEEEERVIAALLRSKRWSSLPWQQETGGER